MTIAGNPVLSTPNADRLDAALAGLEFMVSVDIYVNETTRHADVILPVPSRAAEVALRPGPAPAGAAQRRQLARPVLPLDEGQPDEWEVLAKLALIAMGQGPDADPAVVDDLTFGALAAHVDESVVASEVVDAADGPGADPRPHAADGPYELTLDELLETPTASTSAPLEPRIPEALRTPSGKIELAPEPIVADVDRLRRQPRSRQRRRHRRSGRSCSSAAGTSGRTTPGCTTSTCS